jgi:hypothetical protein
MLFAMPELYAARAAFETPGVGNLAASIKVALMAPQISAGVAVTGRLRPPPRLIPAVDRA